MKSSLPSSQSCPLLLDTFLGYSLPSLDHN
jgi:hypothetical protein